jgi:hypothetical protein
MGDSWRKKNRPVVAREIMCLISPFMAASRWAEGFVAFPGRNHIFLGCACRSVGMPGGVHPTI